LLFVKSYVVVLVHNITIPLSESDGMYKNLVGM